MIDTIHSLIVASGSWFEWIVCFISAVAGTIAFWKGRRWLIVALLAIVAGWLLGTAKALLLPALIGILALWVLVHAQRRWKLAGLTLALGGSFASALLCWVFPLPDVPALSGPHAVGTLTFEIPAEGKSAALLVQVWYPAMKDKAALRTPWLADPALAPRFPFHRIGSAIANAQIALRPSEVSPRLPVIFYEHAWNGHKQENVAQVEDLASQGFVIVAMDHPGQAGRIRYGDGKVIMTHLPASFKLASESEVDDFEKLAEQCLDERIQDLARVRTAMARGAPAQLAGMLILERVGVFGFSFGGTSALRLCAVDPTFCAGANEDGMFLGNDSPGGPFLFFDEQMPGWLLKSASPTESAEDAQTRRSEERIRKAMKMPDRFRVILDGTLHPAFTDRIFTCRIPWLARVGKRPSMDVHRIITTQLRDFFKRELNPYSRILPSPMK